MAIEDPQYAEYAPGPQLAPFVYCVWTFSGGRDDAPQPIVPDARPELIIHLRAPYREKGADADQPLALFAGQLTRPLILQSRGDVAMVGIRFRPDGSRAFLGAPVDSATDRRVDLADVKGARAAVLVSAVRRAGDLREAANEVERFVADCLRGAAIDAAVRSAVARDMAQVEAGPPEHVPDRSFQRRFKAEVGVSLRMFRSIRRFRRVFDALQDPANSGWAEAALRAGYFDQPQMARDFRRFLGCTARQWATQQIGLARALGQSKG